MRRTRRFAIAAFCAIGGSSALLGALEFGIALTHVRGRPGGNEVFAAGTGLVLVALGAGFVRRALRLALRRPHVQ